MGNVYAYCYDTSNNYQGGTGYPQETPTDTWHYVAVILQQNYIAYYLNGTFMSSDSWGTGDVSSGDFPIIIGDFGQNYEVDIEGKFLMIKRRELDSLIEKRAEIGVLILLVEK